MDVNSFKMGGSTHTSLYNACSVHLYTYNQTLRNPGNSHPSSEFSQIGYFSRWDPRIHAFAFTPSYKNLDLKNWISSFLFPAYIADLPPLLFLSFPFLSLFLYIFFCAPCCLQQLLNCKYLGSPLTCCLLERHTIIRGLDKIRPLTPHPYPQGATTLRQHGRRGNSLQTTPSPYSLPNLES